MGDYCVHSLAYVRHDFSFKYVILKQITLIDFLNIFTETACWVVALHAKPYIFTETACWAVATSTEQNCSGSCLVQPGKK